MQTSASRPDGGTALRSRAIIAVVAIVLAAAGGFAALAMRSRRSVPAQPAETVTAGLAAGDLPSAFDVGSELTAWVGQTRAAGATVARSRFISDAMATAMRTSGAQLVTIADDTPRSRTPDGIFRALRAADGKATTLDLARLGTAVLRASGTAADVAERVTAPRPDQPADPSGVLGSYVVAVEDTVIDVGPRTVIPAGEARIRRLDNRAVAGAMLAQSALNEAVTTGRRDRALALAEAAVNNWRDGLVPLAVRSRVWLLAGASGGVALADQDLASAAALRDDAPIHMLRARLALLTGNLRLASSETARAFARTRNWGDAALASAIFAPLAENDAGDACVGLAASHDPWTDDALMLCRHNGSADEMVNAAARLMRSSRDPLRVAYAAAHGADGAGARVRADEKPELAAWLAVLGRRDLALVILGRVDAGQ